MTTPSRDDRTRDPVNQQLVEARDLHGLARLGLMTSVVWREDPKRLVFTLARYKFVAKMLTGRSRVLEIGCGDGFGARIVAAEVDHVVATDFDSLFIGDVAARGDLGPRLSAQVLDILVGPAEERFDAVYSLDVMEHIEPEREGVYLDHIVASLTEQGVLIVGMPSLESQQYASPASKAGHVNCKSGTDLKRTLETRFHNVFMFSMNDEVVHTGFMPMAHYLFGLCVGPRR